MARQIDGGSGRGLYQLDGILRSKFSYVRRGGLLRWAPGKTQPVEVKGSSANKYRADKHGFS